jgi:hypothetical protein
VRDALTLTIACAFGTTTWAIASQALWQHGPAQLALVAALLAATAPPTICVLALAGACAVLLAAMRLPDLLLALPVAVFCLLRARGGRQLGAFLAGALGMTALVLACNLAAAGRLAGGSAFHPGSGRSDEVLYSSPAAPWHPGNAQFLLELRGAGAVR